MKSDRTTHLDVRRLLIGTGTGILCFLLGSLILAFILMKKDLSYSSIKIGCFTLTVISSFAAGFISKKKNRQKGIVCGLLAAVPLVLLELALLALFNRFHTSEEALLLIPAGILFGMIGGIISSNLR